MTSDPEYNYDFWQISSTPDSVEALSFNPWTRPQSIIRMAATYCISHRRSRPLAGRVTASFRRCKIRLSALAECYDQVAARDLRGLYQQTRRVSKRCQKAYHQLCSTRAAADILDPRQDREHLTEESDVGTKGSACLARLAFYGQLCRTPDAEGRHVDNRGLLERLQALYHINTRDAKTKPGE
jgi:hypothetical protein